MVHLAFIRPEDVVPHALSALYPESQPSYGGVFSYHTTRNPKKDIMEYYVFMGLNENAEQIFLFFFLNSRLHLRRRTSGSDW